MRIAFYSQYCGGKECVQEWMLVCRKRIGKLRSVRLSCILFQGFFMADSHVTGSCRLRKVPLDRLFAITSRMGIDKETLDLRVFHSVVNINYWFEFETL